MDRFAILDVKDGKVAEFRNGVVGEHLSYGAAYHPYLNTALVHVVDEKQVSVKFAAAAPVKLLFDIKASDTQRYNRIKKNLAEQRITLPPSAAMAGIYARVDRDRGVWKAPANVGVMSVIGPQVQISHDQQASLNVDPDTGKSINALRAFPGRGTLVWGARTLAGNDNEWRYVPVRRLFIMIEESAKKASAFAVFEPNDATTWLKVKGMLESYLFGLWEAGALQGAKPEAAFYVSVGLGKTMHPQDILEGRMIVEIGIAAVRPAEFIVLRFSHKLAEA
jgi:phage tail sheath protein FI